MSAHPWDRKPSDTDKSYAAFHVYMLLGEDRSLATVAEQLGKSLSQVEAWSSKGGWVRRVAAYDDWTRAKLAAATQKKRLAAVERILDTGDAGVRRYGQWLVNDMPEARLTGAEMVALFRASTDAVLKAAGNPNRLEVSGPNGEPLHGDDLSKAIERAVGRLAIEHPEALEVLLDEFRPRED